MKGKVILVAGAAGFIPSHLCEFYLNLGARVIGLDNFQTGSVSNIDLLSRFPQFSFEEVNIYEKLPSFEGLPIDYIYSLASPASPIDFPTIPLEIMRVNSEGTRNLLELAREKGSRFLEASTSEIYGDPEIHPQKEDYVGHVNCIGPRSCYDESKRFAEALTMTYLRKFNVDTRIVRIFNTYGPRMRPDDGRVIPNFINQALQGEDITVYGSGKQTRSFCYVSDLIRAIHHVLMGDDPTPFNVGNPDEYPILEAAKIIIDILKSPSQIIFCPLPEDDPKRRRPDLTKLRAMTDFSLEVDFRTGLLKTAEFFKSLL